MWQNAMILSGNVDGVHCRVDELEVREGGHVDAGAATVGLRNLVQLSLKISLSLGGGVNHATIGGLLLSCVLLDLVHKECLDRVSSSSHGRGVGAQAAPGKGDRGSAQGHHLRSLVEVNQAIKAWSF